MTKGAAICATPAAAAALMMVRRSSMPERLLLVMVTSLLPGVMHGRDPRPAPPCRSGDERADPRSGKRSGRRFVIGEAFALGDQARDQGRRFEHIAVLLLQLEHTVADFLEADEIGIEHRA